MTTVKPDVLLLLALASNVLVVVAVCAAGWVWRRGWFRGSHRAGLGADVALAVLVTAVTAVVSVPVWTWLLGLG